MQSEVHLDVFPPGNVENDFNDDYHDDGDEDDFDEENEDHSCAK